MAGKGQRLGGTGCKAGPAGRTGAEQTPLRRRIAELEERLAACAGEQARQEQLEAHTRALFVDLENHREELLAQNEDLRRSQRELEASQRKYQELFDLAPIGYFSLDRSGCVIEINQQAASLLGHERRSCIGRPFLVHVHPAWRALFSSHLSEVCSGHECSDEIVLQRRDGTRIPVQFSSVPVLDRSGKVLRCRTALFDLREHKRQQRIVSRTTRAYRVQAACNHALVRATSRDVLLQEVCRIIVEKGDFLLAWVGLLEDDDQRTIRPVASWGPHADFIEKLNVSYGRNRGGRGPSGRAVRTGRAVVCRSIAHDPAFGSLRDEALQRGLNACISLPLMAGETCLGVVGIYAGEEQEFDEDECALLTELADQIAFGLVALRTRTERTAALEQVQKLAYFDTLTGLPNRRMFLDRLGQAIALTQREEQSLALLFLDLDRFKDVNDTIGHDGGDALLQSVAKRLRGCVRQSDIVARLGGDEFVIIFHSVQDQAQVVTVANKILAAFSQPFSVCDREIHSSTSIGIALFPADGDSVEALIRHADAAMYHAKDDGRQTYRFFSPEMNRRIQAKLVLEQHFRQAWQREEVFLHYQPQIDLRSGEVVGVEALTRWQSPALGLVEPGRFIPLAEETGLILPFGEWALRTACRQVSHWHRAGFPDLRLAVNISARQFRQPEFIDTVDRILDETGFNPKRLMLEMTESTVMEKTDEAIMTLTDLKIRGIGLSLDDFGTGYSSLNHLRSFPIDQIKIDRSFLADLGQPYGQAAIIEAMIAMAHSLGLKVVAEGVEEKAQVDFLIHRHCDEVQGHFWARPLAAAALPGHLRGQGHDNVEKILH